MRRQSRLKPLAENPHKEVTWGDSSGESDGDPHQPRVPDENGASALSPSDGAVILTSKIPKISENAKITNYDLRRLPNLIDEESPKTAALECNKCLRIFKHNSGLATHKKYCKAQNNPDTQQTQSADKAISVRELKELMNSIEGNSTTWPANFRKRTSELTVGKLPKGSWDEITKFYQEKFENKTSTKIIQRLASRKNANYFLNNIYKPSAKEVSDNQLSIKIKNLFLTEYNCNETENNKPTKKFQEERLPAGTWKYLNKIIVETCSNQLSVREITKAYRSAQKAIESLLEKRKDQIPNYSAKDNNKIIESLDEIILNLEPGEQNKMNDKTKQYLHKHFKNVNKKTIDQTIQRAKEEKARIEKKIRDAERRKLFSTQNYQFDVNRRRFYRELKDGKRKYNLDDDAEKLKSAKEFWSKMWQKNSEDGTNLSQLPDSRGEDETDEFVPYEQYLSIIKNLPNWKTAGVDGVYNITIKRLTSLHKPLFNSLKRIAVGQEIPDQEFYTGKTFLIPKAGESKDGSNYRPITCLNNIYKLLTKLTLKTILTHTEAENCLTLNQFAIIHGTRGSKELALTNEAINNLSNSELCSAWIDAKKAFDSVKHSTVFNELSKLEIPIWTKRIVSKVMNNWHTDIFLDGKKIIEGKKIERGIMQGDALSPFLFCLALNELSKNLTSNFPEIETNNNTHRPHRTNHLIYMDDIKLISKDKHTLKEMIECTRENLENIGLELNQKKSAANIETNIVELIENHNTYKYLGFHENNKNRYSKDTLKQVETEIKHRLSLLLETKLNSKNLFKAINEWVLSLIEYPAGVIEVDSKWAKEIDKYIRSTLHDKNFIAHPASIERLYLNRKNFGRGLTNCETKVENALTSLASYLGKTETTESKNTRKAIIRNFQNKEGSSLSKAIEKAKKKYGTASLKEIKDMQQNKLAEKINDKCVHRVFLSDTKRSEVCKEESARIFTNSNVSPKEEAQIQMLQDRNYFWKKKNCEKCGSPNSVEHMATKCISRLHNEYKRRHDEAVKCIAMKLYNNNSAQKVKHIRKFTIGDIIQNGTTTIHFDRKFKTTNYIKYNHPDIVMIDKSTSKITIIEVGITSIDNLTRVTNEKRQKYQPLAEELASINKLKEIDILPIIYTFDGLTTRTTKRSLEIIRMNNKEKAYLQSRIIKRSSEIINNEAYITAEEKRG